MFNKLYENSKRFIVNNYKFLIFITIILILFWIQLPFVVYTPGGTIDLGKRIDIENSYKVDGKIQMSYVTMAKGTISNLLLAKILPNWDITPKSEVAYENETLKESIKADKIEMEAAIDNAVITAYRLAGQDINITNYHNIITYISKEANTDLKLFDEVIEIDNQSIETLEDCKKIVATKKVGDILNFKVLHNEKEKNATATVYTTEYGNKVGLSFTTLYDYKTDRDVKIKSKSSEYGPSGGTMMALSIYNYLTEEDITKGMNIAGTGTIDQDGNIGEIGGVKYKLLGAIKNDADIFIVPKENEKEAKKVAKEKDSDIIIITDKTLSGIIEQLKLL